jgi:SAM-dependent methyltransferase
MSDDGREHLSTNRRAWDEHAERYQALNESRITEQMTSGDIPWGVWHVPESERPVLGDVSGKDVLELGCGAAQWSIALIRKGARPVGLDMSGKQLEMAARNRRTAGVDFPLVQASGEDVPFADGSFDVVFADYGAFHFADPYRTVPESSRVLRPGGLLAFTTISPLQELFWEGGDDHPGTSLIRDYFGMHRIDDPGEDMVSFNLPYGEWFALLRRSGFEVTDLIETRPEEGATSTYRDQTDLAWARRWPSELLIRATKTTEP